MKPIDLNALKSFDLASRPSHLFVEDLGTPCAGDVPTSEWIHSLPRRAVTETLRRIHDHLGQCAESGEPVVVGVSADFVLSGCSRYLQDWMRSGLVSGLALEGQALYHDLELCLGGKTGENRADSINAGQLGLAREAVDVLAVSAHRASKDGVGLGEAVGREMEDHPTTSREASLVYAACQEKIPCLVFSGVGADPTATQVHVPSAHYAEASLLDFRIFCSLVATLQKGTWLEFGTSLVTSAFCQAVSVVRNLGFTLDELTTISLGERSSETRSIYEKLGRQNLELPGPWELSFPLVHQTLACRRGESSVLPYAA